MTRPVLIPVQRPVSPRRDALHLLGAALRDLAAACQDIRRISRTG